MEGISPLQRYLAHLKHDASGGGGAADVEDASSEVEIFLKTIGLGEYAKQFAEEG